MDEFRGPPRRSRLSSATTTSPTIRESKWPTCRSLMRIAVLRTEPRPIRRIIISPMGICGLQSCRMWCARLAEAQRRAPRRPAGLPSVLPQDHSDADIDRYALVDVGALGGDAVDDKLSQVALT